MAENTFTGNKEFMSEIEDAKMEFGFNRSDEIESTKPNLDQWARDRFEIRDQVREYEVDQTKIIQQSGQKLSTLFFYKSDNLDSICPIQLGLFVQSIRIVILKIWAISYSHLGPMIIWI